MSVFLQAGTAVFLVAVNWTRVRLPEIFSRVTGHLPGYYPTRLVDQDLRAAIKNMMVPTRAARLRFNKIAGEGLKKNVLGRSSN